MPTLLVCCTPIELGGPRMTEKKEMRKSGEPVFISLFIPVFIMGLAASHSYSHALGAKVKPSYPKFPWVRYFVTETRNIANMLSCQYLLIQSSFHHSPCADLGITVREVEIDHLDTLLVHTPSHVYTWVHISGNFWKADVYSCTFYRRALSVITRRHLANYTMAFPYSILLL